MANQQRDPRAYELMTVFVPDISEEDTQAQVDKVAQYITNAGGSVTETLVDSPWGRRRLAYTIRYNGTDYRDGFYTVYHFDSAPSLLGELERDLKLDTSVMRYLLVHDDPKAGEKPSEDELAEGAEGETEAADSAAAPAAEAETTQETPAAAEEAPAEPETGEAETTQEASATEADAPAEEAPAEPEAAAEASSTEEAASSGTESTAEASTDETEDNTSEKE